MSAFPKITAEVVARHGVPGPRYTSYPTAPEWVSDFSPQDYASRLEAAGRTKGPLSLYFHLPFCQEMCTFCGCNVVIARDHTKADTYVEHVRKELNLAARHLGDRRQFSQLHYGGGTPTFLDEAQLERLWKYIREQFAPMPEAEIAIEVDPVVTTNAQLAVLRAQGFNRLSMGVQDFDPEVQATIRRVQSVEQTAGILTEARRLGFAGINIDLIYGLPNQRPETWQRTLSQVLALRPDRVAVYSFAYVPDMRPHQKRLAQEIIPSGMSKLALFAQAYDAFVQAGYRTIGMDHFALPTDELSVAQDKRTLWRNFQGYTVRRASDVVAFGVTGIGDLAGAYAQNVRPLPRYYAALEEGRFATERGFVLSDDDRRRRDVITQIMCNFWADLGPEGATYFERELGELAQLEREGFVQLSGTQIEVTQIGRVFVRNVAMVFDAYLARSSEPRSFSNTV